MLGKSVSLSIFILTVIVLLSACSDNLEPKKQSVIQDEGSDVVELRVMHRWPPELGVMGDLLRQMLADFDEANEDISIKVDSTPSSMYEQQLTVRLASGDGPDVYAFWPGGRTESQLRKGDIMEISDVWEENDLPSVLKKSVIAGSTHMDGNIYTLPMENKPNTFWYNVSIFEELGVEPPETWQELLSIAYKSKEAGYIPFALGGKITRWMPAFWFDYLLLNTAGGEFRENLMWGEESWESEEVYRVFEMWKYTIEQGYFNEDMTEIDSRQASLLVAEGKAVMMLQGPWSINYFMDEIGDLRPIDDFDLFAFPQVIESVPKASEGAILSWAINPNSNDERIEASKRLMAYLTSEEAITYLSKERKTLGSRNDIGYDIYDEELREMMVRLDEETKDAPLFMNFELATLPPVQDAGMDAFVEFLNNPEDYKAICAKVEKVSRATFDQ